MLRSLRAKLLLLLVTVSVIALSSALYLRHMMVRDFREYIDGERLDQVYRVTADVESSFELNRGWEPRLLARSVIRAYMLGMEVRIHDQAGERLMDTGTALTGLTSLLERRVLSMTGGRRLEGSGDFVPHPLFLRGRRIGTLEVRFFAGDRSALFVERSNRFLLLSFLLMGGVAFLASLVLSRRLTAPIRDLVSSTIAIRKGNLEQRSPVTGDDEIGRLGEAFNAMAADLQFQESLRRKLVANVAHELRTPLGAMKAELEGMIDGVIEVGQDQVRSLHEETDRLAKILDGIDDLTQAQASSLTLARQKVEVEPLLEGVRGRYRARASEKGVDLRLDVREGTEAWADPDRLSQIIVNLMDNALRATPTKGTVTLRAFGHDNRTVIEVVDTGEGIPEDDVTHIFERFYRGESGGLGLGLAIVKELVDAHGGGIEVESEVGKGTAVTVILPSDPKS